MEQNRKKSLLIIGLVILSAVIMAFIETVIEPSYFIKSAFKVVCFLIIPLLIIKPLQPDALRRTFSANKKGLAALLLLGLGLYAIIMIAYFLTKNLFDYSALVSSLSEDQAVTADSFWGVALYISFGNSLLEEFMFRVVSFLILSAYLPKKAAYLFSAMMFAVYHVAMIGGSFPVPLVLLSLFGLTVGGLIFNYVDDRTQNLYPGWMIHMFADFAIMTIWYLHI